MIISDLRKAFLCYSVFLFLFLFLFFFVFFLFVLSESISLLFKSFRASPRLVRNFSFFYVCVSVCVSVCICVYVCNRFIKINFFVIQMIPNPGSICDENLSFVCPRVSVFACVCARAYVCVCVILFYLYYKASIYMYKSGISQFLKHKITLG